MKFAVKSAKLVKLSTEMSHTTVNFLSFTTVRGNFGHFGEGFSGFKSGFNLTKEHTVATTARLLVPLHMCITVREFRRHAKLR